MSLLCILIWDKLKQIVSFSGHCLLFSKGTWQEEDGQLLVAWGSRAYCTYVIAVGVLMFIVCCVQIYRQVDSNGLVSSVTKIVFILISTIESFLNIDNQYFFYICTSHVRCSKTLLISPTLLVTQFLNRLSMFMYRGTDSSFLSAFMEAVGCAVLCALAVSAASMVTLGFITWCQNIVERFPRYIHIVYHYCGNTLLCVLQS